MAITYNGKQHDHFYLNGEKFRKFYIDQYTKFNIGTMLWSVYKDNLGLHSLQVGKMEYSAQAKIIGEIVVDNTFFLITETLTERPNILCFKSSDISISSKM